MIENILDENENAVEIGTPDLGQLIERITIGLDAPRLREEGVADLPDGCFRREGNDDNKNKGDDAADGEQTDDNMENGFRSHADGV